MSSAEGAPPGADKVAQLLDRLEFFCASGDFTGFIQEFASVHSGSFVEGEQTMQQHALYQQYHEGIEAKLQEFCRGEGIEEAQLLEAVTAAESSDYGSTTCLDYIIASSEYDSFLTLMLDCQDMYNWCVPHRRGGGGQAARAAAPSSHAQHVPVSVFDCF